MPFPTPITASRAEQSLAAFDMLFKADIDPDRVAAIIIEPVQGEGGFNAAPADFLQALRGICDEHGILLIADEIQTGFGRTGTLFAIEHSGVAPDLITVAKSLGGGFPIVGRHRPRRRSWTRPRRAASAAPMRGNPLACAAALAVLDIIAEEKLPERALALGARITGRLMRWRRPTGSPASATSAARRHGGDGTGHRSHDARAGAGLARRLVHEAAAQGLVLLSCGVYGNVIRFLPPLTASDAIIDEGLDIVGRALEAVVSA